MQNTDPSTKEYWEERVEEQKHDLSGMIFQDQDREIMWDRFHKFFEIVLKDYKVLDVCCGHGQFSVDFPPEKYLGIDFSENMIALARERHPKHKFELQDAREYIPEKKFDIIFECNSLRSLGMTPIQFRDLYLPYAKVAVICLEKSEITIFNKYDRKHN